ncbi:SDR family NAD(P)-dependent oxidoreductase [Bosea minatitlanensis]|uniref:SDR family NAD(P)-dependent oxidoreductase n=1 Tax=Bosea minatitlanensis TaxID=128782 RepID=A0ABW0F208_9HYPH|nr:SDR family NAD(P)-dependent oxidoreductase [Bosea minatitlanensis]MCT4494163.1 SDR family oxidoreductase [Bosea minatitlanensis]
MKIDFSGRAIIVTGAGGGFGRPLSQALEQLGARVFASDINAAGLEDIRSPNITTKTLDLTDRAAAAAWVKEIEETTGGPIDVLINNAGGALGLPARPIETVPDEEWDRIIDVNLNGAFAMCRAVSAGMKAAGKGRIINISSGAGFKPSLTGVQAYCSAKHALIGLTRQLAVELGPFGITVNSVAPGLVLMSEGQKERWANYSQEYRDAFLRSVSLRRFGSAEDISNGVIFFASDLSSFITGQVLSVSGGA